MCLHWDWAVRAGDAAVGHPGQGGHKQQHTEVLPSFLYFSNTVQPRPCLYPTVTSVNISHFL